MEPTLAFVIPVGGGHSPVDPGFGRPGGGWNPTDPGFGVGGGGGSTLPVRPPVGVWPPPLPPPGVWPAPPVIDNGLPPVPPGGGVDNTLPEVPGVPVYPSGGPILPGTIWPPLPPPFAGKVIALVVVFGIGYRWAVLDTDLKPDNTLPPTATPK